MEYVLIRNQPHVEHFLRLRETAGWSRLHERQAISALKNSILTVSAIHNGRVIGMGRLVGDGFTICYVQDLIVSPEHQGKGVGKAILKELLDYIQESAIPNTKVTVGLFAAKGRDAFYESFGFLTRPNEHKGAGMELSINAKEHNNE